MDDAQTKHKKVRIALIFLALIILILHALNSNLVIKNLYINLFYPNPKSYSDFFNGVEPTLFFWGILLIVNFIVPTILLISIKDTLTEKIGYGLITFGCSLAITFVLSLLLFIAKVFFS